MPIEVEGRVGLRLLPFGWGLRGDRHADQALIRTDRPFLGSLADVEAEQIDERRGDRPRDEQHPAIPDRQSHARRLAHAGLPHIPTARVMATRARAAARMPPAACTRCASAESSAESSVMTKPRL